MSVHRDGHVRVEAPVTSGYATVLHHTGDCEDPLEINELEDESGYHILWIIVGYIATSSTMQALVKIPSLRGIYIKVVVMFSGRH